MAVFALTNVFAFVAGHDFTGDSNQAVLNVDAQALDATVFGATYRSQAGGLRSSKFQLDGFWQSATSDSVDSEAFPDLGTVNRTHTMGPDQTAGGTAYLWQAGRFNYQAFGKLGELVPFTLSSMGTDGAGVVRGQLAAAKQTVSATGPLGSGLNLGSVSATQKLYASLHVLGTPGTSVTVTVESATSNTFGTPATRGTFGPLTAAGGSWMTPVAGSISHTWYRLNVTAITGSFVLAGAIGIQ